MTMTRTSPCWRNAGLLPVYRTLVSGVMQFRPMAGVDYFPVTLDLDAFEFNDPEMSSSDASCPCGVGLSADDVGDLLREIYRHCAAAGHPRPIFEFWWRGREVPDAQP